MEEADSAAAAVARDSAVAVEADSAAALAVSAEVVEADSLAVVASAGAAVVVSAGAGVVVSAGADSAAAVELSAEEASVAVLAACLRHAAAGHMSDRVHLAVIGHTRTPDPEAFGQASRTVRAEPWFQGGHRLPLTLTVVGTLLRSAAVAPERPLRLPGFDQELLEAGGNRSAEVVRLRLRAVRQEAPQRPTRWQGGTPYPGPPLFQGFVAHSGFRTSAIFVPNRFVPDCFAPDRMPPPPQVRALAVRPLLAHIDRYPGQRLHSATPRARELRSTVLVLAVSTDLGISAVSPLEILTMISTISSFSRTPSSSITSSFTDPSSGVAVSVSAASVSVSVSAVLISDSARHCGGDLAGHGGMGGLDILTGYRMATACPMTWA